MIELLRLQNFKSARELTVPLRKLTVLSGLNGSGKSTVLQALAMLFQSVEENITTFGKEITKLQLNGKLVRLGTFASIYSDRAENPNITISLSKEKDFIEEAKGFSWQEWTATGNPDSDVLELTGNREETLSLLLDDILENGVQFLAADRLTPQTLYDRSDSVSRDNSFLGNGGQFTPDFLARKGDLHEVPIKRRCGDNLPNIPPELIQRIDSTPKLLSQIGRWLQFLSPGVKLNAEFISETDSVKLAFSYASTQTGQDSSSRRPSHVGFGLTYCLPILTACLSAKSGAILLLENPEAHLHPRGQVAMGLLLAKCATDGVQIIVETHSDHILNGIRLAVKNNESEISPEDVSICNFNRNPTTGDSYIENPLILPDGSLSSWPDGFFDEWEKSLEALLG